MACTFFEHRQSQFVMRDDRFQHRNRQFCNPRYAFIWDIFPRDLVEFFDQLFLLPLRLRNGFCLEAFFSFLDIQLLLQNIWLLQLLLSHKFNFLSWNDGSSLRRWKRRCSSRRIVGAVTRHILTLGFIVSSFLLVVLLKRGNHTRLKHSCSYFWNA